MDLQQPLQCRELTWQNAVVIAKEDQIVPRRMTKGILEVLSHRHALSGADHSQARVTEVGEYGSGVIGAAIVADDDFDIGIRDRKRSGEGVPEVTGSLAGRNEDTDLQLSDFRTRFSPPR